jgi:hypothetical protein
MIGFMPINGHDARTIIYRINFTNIVNELPPSPYQAAFPRLLAR